ncbi:MAG: hypothetical protein JWQ40_3774 [Segetibacter sp.]|nr:hypothetical protein [Segetibacter sp.]
MTSFLFSCFFCFLIPAFCTIRIIVATLGSTFNSLIELSIAFFTLSEAEGYPELSRRVAILSPALLVATKE